MKQSVESLVGSQQRSFQDFETYVKRQEPEISDRMQSGRFKKGKQPDSPFANDTKFQTLEHSNPTPADPTQPIQETTNQQDDQMMI